MTRVTVDAMMQGVSRVYWYAWLADMTDLPVKIWPGSPGERVLRSWSEQGRWRLTGCVLGPTYRCTFAAPDGARRSERVPTVVVTPG